MKLLRIAATGCCLLLFGGCAVTSFLVSEKDNYLEAQTVPDIEFPEDLDGSRIQDAWVIPEIPEQAAARVYPEGAPRPATIVGDKDPNTIRIQRLGTRRWMVLQRKPDTVWPLVRQYLSDQGLEVAVERPEDGIIVTAPIDFADTTISTDLLDLIIENYEDTFDGDYMVFRIEQGIRRGTSEVHMRYMGRSEQETEGMWLTGREDVGPLEGKLLTAVAEFDVSEESESTFSSVARHIATQAKASLIRDDEGYPVLTMNIDHERVWASMTKALESAEIEVAEARNDDLEFAVELSPELLGQSERGGFFGFGKRNRAKLISAIVDITEEAAGFSIRVQYADGRSLDTEVAEQLLVLLREHAA